MTKFIKKTIIFILILFFLLFTFEMIVNTGLRKSDDFLLSEWNDIVNGEINSDIIINGSSRAWVHISPKILEENINLSTYNLGLDGFHFNMQYARFKSFLEYNVKPKVVIQTLDIFSLVNRNGLYKKEQFYPYLNENHIYEATQDYKGLNWFDYNLPLIKYRTDPEYLIKGFLEFFSLYHFTNDKYKGFEAQKREWGNSFKKFHNENKNGIEQKVNEDILLLFDTFLKKCKENNIQVLLVYPPEYIEAQRLYTNREEIIKIYREFAIKYNFYFLDYSDSFLSYKNKYFYNSQHLNKNGAVKFSNILAEDLKKYKIIQQE